MSNVAIVTPFKKKKIRIWVFGLIFEKLKHFFFLLLI